MKKTIIFDATHCTNEFGGISGYLNDHLKKIVDRPSYEIVILLPEGISIKESLKDFKIFRIKPIYPIRKKILNRFINYARVKKHFPDSIIINPYYDQIAYGKNAFVTIHDLAFFEKGLKYPIKTQIFYYFFILVNSITSGGFIVISQNLKNLMMSKTLFRILPYRSLYYLPNNLNFDVKPKKNLHSEDYFLYTGGEEKRKNLDLIFSLRYINRSDEYGDILIYYTGKSWDKKLIADLKNNGIRSKCLGFLPTADLHEIINDSLGIIYPSLSEGFGRPLQEAAIFSKPCICMELPVYKEFFGDSPIYIKNKPRDLLNAFFYVLTEKKPRAVKLFNAKTDILDFLEKVDVQK